MCNAEPQNSTQNMAEGECAVFAPVAIAYHACTPSARAARPRYGEEAFCPSREPDAGGSIQRRRQDFSVESTRRACKASYSAHSHPRHLPTNPPRSPLRRPFSHRDARGCAETERTTPRRPAQAGYTCRRSAWGRNRTRADARRRNMRVGAAGVLRGQQRGGTRRLQEGMPPAAP